MTDSTDQIAALHRRFGGNPDRMFGQSPNEKARMLQERGPDRLERRILGDYESIEQLTAARPLNPQRYPLVCDMMHEVTTNLNAAAPRLYRIDDYEQSPIFMAAYIYPNHYVLDMELFNRLEPDEQRALLYHEVAHSQQDMANGLRSKRLSSALLDRPWLGALGDWLQEKCIAYQAGFEYEANAVAAAYTSPDAVQRALVKSMAMVWTREHPDIPVDLNQPLHQVAAQLDEYFGMDSPAMRSINGGTIREKYALLEVMKDEHQQAQCAGRSL